MPPKTIAYAHQGREVIRRGVRQLARAVKVTLGPCGRNVMFNKGFDRPLITRDGATVAKQIDLPDPMENVGRIVAEAMESIGRIGVPTIEEGVLPGGGVAVLRCLPALDKMRKTLIGDQRIGSDIVSRALRSPIKQIAKNAGQDGSIVLNKVLSSDRASLILS